MKVRPQASAKNSKYAFKLELVKGIIDHLTRIKAIQTKLGRERTFLQPTAIDTCKNAG
ncbi:hypothetical protein [Roseateles sp.]|uniref:hypothetical protein n=1 Tax=Roseateles sp. TaxID=1971397 RepID=UPI00286C2D81|nr:hypothetical protein [Roseateles sp.]